MRKKYVGLLLIAVMCMVGCANNTIDKVNNDSTENLETIANGTADADKEDVPREGKAGTDKFDPGAEFMDLRLGDPVNVASAGMEETWKYKFTLNSVEYSEGQINGHDGGGYDFMVLDITVEGAGPDVSYGVILTDLFLGASSQVMPELQADYGLNTFANADDTLSDGEVVRGRVAALYEKIDVTVERRAMLTTKFLYAVELDEIRDYVPGEQ